MNHGHFDFHSSGGIIYDKFSPTVMKDVDYTISMYSVT